MNGKKKNGKEKPRIIETGDSYPIIDEKDISNPEEVAKHGWKVAENGEYLGRWPVCPHCGKYIEKLKIRGQDVDLLDRDIVSEKGKINYKLIMEKSAEKSKAIKDETTKAVPSIQVPRRQVSMKNIKYLLVGVVVIIIGFFAYKYFFNREGQR